MSTRQLVDDRLDRVRFQLDRRKLDYQPLPWLGVDHAPRARGVRSRWRSMSAVIDDVGGETAVDIGCNAGYFVISLATRGVATVGVESDARYARVLAHARDRLHIDNVGVLTLKLSPTTQSLVPGTDITLLLSVWHHVVRDFGLDAANRILAKLWDRTQRVMFFETGEDEMPGSWGLPHMGPDPAAFLHGFLLERCHGSKVEHLGLHAAFDADRNPCKRNLFAVIRTKGV